MKRKYLNNEKVSDNYLLKRYQKVLTNFAEFKDKKMAFAVEKFELELNRIYENTEFDNFQKLSKIIELEREFTKYLKTKEFLLDLIYDYIQNERDVFVIKGTNFQVNGPFVFAFVSGNPNYEVYDYAPTRSRTTLAEFMKRHYYGEHPAINYERLIKQLTDKDIADLKKLLAKKYRNIFLAEDIQGFTITYSYIFLETEGAQIIAFIAKQFMNAYWEQFDYSEDSELAQNFKQEVMKNIREPQRFLELAKNSDFWYMLVHFREYYNFSSTFESLDSTICVISENKEVHQQEKKVKERYKLSESEATQKLEEISNGKPLSTMLADLDFSALNLRQYAITTHECTLSNVSFEDTGITIDFSKTNQSPIVYYIKGERIDYRNLTTSCFKGCKIEEASFDVLNEFTFSINTFDVDILKNAGLYFEDVPENLLNKFYYKETLSMNEFNMLADKFGIDKVKMRYSNLKIESFALEWLTIKKRVLC